VDRRMLAFGTIRAGSAVRSWISSWRSACIAPFALVIGLTSASHGQGPNSTKSSTVLEPPASQMAEPGYLEPISDPLFGTSYVRITKPGGEIVPRASCGLHYCRHRYSSAQAWNADQSLLVITAGCPGFCFLDGKEYRPLFWRPGSRTECEWHPTDPALMICVADREIYSWEVRNDVKRSIYLSKSHAGLRFGPSKGNLSLDGAKLAVRAVNVLGDEVVFVYDIVERKKYPDISLSELEGANSYCTVSPSGRFIFCYQRSSENTNTAYVLTLEGDRVQHWAEHHRPGHGDLTVDEDGQDVYVGISKSQLDKFHVIKRRLEDGAITDLLTRSSAQHVSARSIKRPGWVFVTFGTASATGRRAEGWAPYIQEIAALKLDGSGSLRRIVHTQSAKHDYWSEPHASPSPDGSKVIWASNWGHPGGPVSSYVASIIWEP
jgi:hypothetical protein